MSARPQPRPSPARGVLEVTIAHLAEKGYAGLSVPDVAVEAGVHKTSVYRRFATKAALVEAALGRAMGHDVVPVDTGTLRGDMLQVARAALAFAGAPTGRAVVRTLLADGDHEVRTLAATVLASQQQDAPRLVIARGIARGELPADVDAAMIFRAIAGTILHRLLVEDGPVDDTFLEGLVDLVLPGAQRRRSATDEAGDGGHGEPLLAERL
jgi:AcrR family transcriptional regulator